MKFWKRNNKSAIQRYRDRINKCLGVYMLLVALYLIVIYSLYDETFIEVIKVLFLPIMLSLAYRMVDWYFNSTDPTKDIKDNQELYNLGIITYDQYNKRKNELIEEVNSRYPYNETQ